MTMKGMGAHMRDDHGTRHRRSRTRYIARAAPRPAPFPLSFHTNSPLLLSVNSFVYLTYTYTYTLSIFIMRYYFPSLLPPTRPKGQIPLLHFSLLSVNPSPLKLTSFDFSSPPPNFLIHVYPSPSPCLLAPLCYQIILRKKKF